MEQKTLHWAFVLWLNFSVAMHGFPNSARRMFTAQCMQTCNDSRPVLQLF